MADEEFTEAQISKFSKGKLVKALETMEKKWVTKAWSKTSKPAVLREALVVAMKARADSRQGKILSAHALSGQTPKYPTRTLSG